MIDHVEIDLRGTLLEARDQEARPTCLAHAATAAHEHTRRASRHLSPEYLHFFASQGHVAGCLMDEVVEVLQATGQCEEGDCPYLPQDPPLGWWPPTGLTLFRRASERKDATATAVEGCLRDGLAPVLGLTLPESFFNPIAPWLISSSGPVRGLHAVVGAGLGRHQGSRVFLVRNSWGTGWGDAGYAWLDDAFIANHLKEAIVLTYEVSP